MSRRRSGYRGQLVVVAAGMLAALALLVASTKAMGQTEAGGNLSRVDGDRPEPSAVGAPTEDREVDHDPRGNPYAAGELLVEYEEDATVQATEEVPEETDAEVEKEIAEIDAELLSFPEVENANSSAAGENRLEAKKEELANEPTVEAVAYNYLRKPAWTPNDPRFSDLWGVEKIETGRAWDNTRGEGVKVAVIDTGIDYRHPEFSNKVVAKYDFVSGTDNADDSYGHGTHVAGTIAAKTNNGEGVSGVCSGCRLVVARALTSKGGYDSDIADAIVWSANRDSKVINLSLGGPTKSAVMEDAVNYAWKKGAVVVAAAGNESTSRPSYPAAYPKAMAVSATTEADRRASYSNYGSWVDISAPGSDVLSTGLNGRYDYRSGTSMSSPHVAGVAGLLASKGLSNYQIRARIESTAVDKGKVDKDAAYGWGRLNAFSTLNGEAAPTIANLRPGPGVKTKDRTPTISATVRDRRTDLAKSNISLFVNGNRITDFTYNARNDRLSLTRKKSMPLRQHSVKIVARDGAGITKVAAWKFSVVR